MAKQGKILLAVNDVGQSYGKLFERFFEKVTGDISVLDENAVDMICFTGGSDVHPSFYGEETGSTTFSYIERDIQEKKIFEFALANNIPMVGICRGSQFLNVMCGGKLAQDITGHAGTLHTVRTYKGSTMLVNSTHHQMSIPTDDALLLAWAEPKISEHYLNGNGLPLKAPVIEVESFCYPDKRVLGWQYHPEMLSGRILAKRPEMIDCIQFVEDTLNEFIF